MAPLPVRVAARFQAQRSASDEERATVKALRQEVAEIRGKIELLRRDTQNRKGVTHLNGALGALKKALSDLNSFEDSLT